MGSLSIRTAFIWSALLLVLAMARVHFRVVTTNVAYHLGKLKTDESALLEERSSLQSEFAKTTNKKNLENLSDFNNNPTKPSISPEKAAKP